MISLVVPFTIGWALVIWAQNFIMLMIGRFLLGLAGGAFCVSAPQYSSEISEKEIRGIVGTFFQVLINGGILFVYVIGAFLDIFLTNIICAIVPLVFGLIFFFMPESPGNKMLCWVELFISLNRFIFLVYLVIEKREEDARKSFNWLRGQKYDPQSEIDDLKAEAEEAERNKVSFGKVLKQRATKRALLIGFGLMFFQQVSGINIVIFYATQIFEVSFSEGFCGCARYT